MSYIPSEEEKVTTDLPGFDKNTNTRAHKDHPARVIVVIDQIKQHNDLYENVGNNLPKNKYPARTTRKSIHTVLQHK